MIFAIPTHQSNFWNDQGLVSTSEIGTCVNVRRCRPHIIVTIGLASRGLWLVRVTFICAYPFPYCCTDRLR